MVGRTLLPYFGGTSAVWVVCLCAFQVLLLGGYLYAHRLSSRPGAKGIGLHLALVFLSAAWVFAAGHVRGRLGELVGGMPPAAGVLVFLVLVAGLPYLALSANASLVQALSANGDRGVYRLYALSNAGSAAGLLLYPLVLEPFVSVSGQWVLLGAGLVVYAVLLSLLARTAHVGGSTASAQASARPSVSRQARWLLLPLVSCAVLNAVTAHLTLDVIALPLLWCLLLAMFLLSYVIGFSGVGGRYAALWDALTSASLCVFAFASFGEGSANFASNLVGGLGVVLFGCTALHVRLYEARPETGLLTRYYLLGAVGGAVGGVLTGLVAPMAFKSVLEYPIALAALVAVLSAVRAVRGRRLHFALASLAVLALSGVFVRERVKAANDPAKTVYRDRGFFGTLKVASGKAVVAGRDAEMHQFANGSTLHGVQFMSPGMRSLPTLYYTPRGGGLAILAHPKYRSGEPMRVGIVGMGIGVSCAYGRSNDVYRCWEISPEVAKLAKDGRFFTFIADSRARVETVVGDARMALEKERDEGAPKYDVIQIDAFAGDAVPYHLSTKEAFRLYFDRLAPGGFLSVHISNWHIDLAPMIKAVADEFGAGAFIYTPTNPDEAHGECKSMWGFLVREPPRGFAPPRGISRLDMRGVKEWALPADEKGSLIGLLRME